VSRNRLLPFDLTWSEVAPAQHPFDSSAALATVVGPGPSDRPLLDGKP
jgi:hypothetical protein